MYNIITKTKKEKFMKRGEIKNIVNQRPRDFTGLQYGKITPTDLDCVLEFGDKVMIFIEAKFQDSDLPFGQRLALTRLCDNCERAGKFSVVLIGRHENEGLIDFANLKLVEYYHKGKWMKPTKPYTVRQAIDKTLSDSNYY
jgi:hypothetical protein